MTDPSPIVCVADLHIQTCSTKRISELNILQWDPLIYFKQILDLASSIGADVVVAGDLFHSQHFEPAYFRVFKKIVESFRKNRQNSKSKIYYILGNHDNSEDWLSVFDCSVYCDVSKNGRGIIELGNGLTIGGIDYVESMQEWEKRFSNLESLGKVDIGLFHQLWYEYLSFSDFRLSELPSVVNQLAVVGHVHIRDIRKIQHATIYSPGSIYPTSIYDQKYDDVAIFDKGKLRFQKIDTRDYIVFKFTNLKSEFEDFDKIVKSAMDRKNERLNTCTKKYMQKIAEPFFNLRIIVTENQDDQPIKNKVLQILHKYNARLFKIKTKVLKNEKSITDLVFIDSEDNIITDTLQEVARIIDLDDKFLTTQNSKNLAKIILNSEADNDYIRKKILEYRDAFIAQQSKDKSDR